MPISTSLKILLLCFFVSSAQAQTIYIKPAEALKIIFQDSREIVSEKKSLTLEQKLKIEKKLGVHLSKDIWNFYVAKSGNKVDGYALIDHEVGKTEPITFLTAMTPQGVVKDVEILIYREPIGSEVHEKRFLKQYQGKGVSDPLRVGQDIKNISGATISARSVSLGVKRAVILWNMFYGK